MTRTAKLFTAMLLVACAMPAFAQDQKAQAEEKPDKIVLEEKLGTVMTSTGGDYESTDLGALLVRDESMMLGEGVKATIVYYYLDREGKVHRKCVEKYEGPNTYVIDDSCKPPAALTGNGRGTIAIIAGAAVIGALISGGSSNPPKTVSGSSR